jgi:hypothetical protein
VKLLKKLRPTPSGTYTEWWWPPGQVAGRTQQAGYRSFEHVLLPEVDPGPDTTYFWAHQFRIIGGEGGYLGLQTKGNLADGTLTKIAIFSLWNAVGAEGPSVMPFGNEGSGWSARIAYPWVAGQPYRLQVFSVGDSWWAASVTDVTGDEREIGAIRVPEQWRQLDTWSVMWTEYYGGPLSRCADMPYSSVIFGTPTANEGEVRPAGSHSRIGDGTCPTSRVQSLADGVRHEMGVPR